MKPEPTVTRRVSCTLTGEDVVLRVNVHRGLMAAQLNPDSYDSGLECNCQEACRAKGVRCQVYMENGMFPVTDEEIFKAQSVVLAYRGQVRERMRRFTEADPENIRGRVREADADGRREAAFFLRFRTADCEGLLDVIDGLIDGEDRHADHATRMEAVNTLVVWACGESGVAVEAARSRLLALAAETSPVAQRQGPEFAAKLRELAQDLTGTG